jgi:hypothetical protein
MRNAVLHRVAPLLFVAPFALAVLPDATGAQVVVPARPPVVTNPKTLPPATVVPAKPAAPAPAPVAAPVAAPATLTQPLALGPGERTGFGFAVGSPGPIVVTVRWSGVPLIISLVKPGGVSVDQQGTGSVTLQYAVAADDVRKGMLWSVSVRPAQASAAPSSAVDMPIKLVVANVVTGTVSVQYPAGDVKLAQAEMTAKANQALAAKPAPQPLSATLSSTLAAKQAALQTALKTQQSAALVALKSKIPAQAFQLSNRVAVSDKASAGMSLAKTATKATGSSQQAQVTSAGSSAPATVASVPVIGSLSVASGQPGDPVLVAGSSFSEVPGEVHFIVANGKDIVAPLTAWSDTQLLAAVPDLSGMQGYNGYIYVTRGGVKSTMVSFRFNPTTELRTLGISGDRGLAGGATFSYGAVEHFGAGNLFGSRGDDQFYLSTKLTNGWTVNAAYLIGYDGAAVYTYGNANAYISEFRPGTDSPYVKVHWWMDAFSSVNYDLRVVISGPKGVPNF